MLGRKREHRRVLIVEDDDAIVRVLRLSLGKNGFDTERVESGRDALAIIDEDGFDAVLLDLCLSDGRGADVLRRLQLQGALPWVVMSALDEDEAVKRFGPLQGPFLPKPFDPLDLIRLLDRLTRKPRTGSGEQLASAAP